MPGFNKRKTPYKISCDGPPFTFNVRRLKQNPQLMRNERVLFQQRIVVRSWFLKFIPMFPPTVLIVTNNRVLVVTMRLFSNSKVLSVNLSQIAQVTLQKNNILTSFVLLGSWLPAHTIRISYGTESIVCYVPFTTLSTRNRFVIPDNKKTRSLYHLIKLQQNQK